MSRYGVAGLLVFWLAMMVSSAMALPMEAGKKQFFDLSAVRKVSSPKSLASYRPQFFSLKQYGKKGSLPLRAVVKRRNQGQETDLARLVPQEHMVPENLTGEGEALFVWPVEEEIAQRISSPFGYRDDPFTGVQAFHAGVDIAAPRGTQVVASADGVVSATGTHPRLGRYVKIEHDGDTYSLYGHLSDWQVSAGTRVRAGERIGKIGSTGRSTGPHLDFSIRKGGEPIDPLPLLDVPDALKKVASSG